MVYAPSMPTSSARDDVRYALPSTAGIASGLLGIGGGVLFVPALVFFAHESQLEAVATSRLRHADALKSLL
jgi:uncharacterized membrane protein YfcA